MTRMSRIRRETANRPDTRERWRRPACAALLLTALVLSVASSNGSEGERADTGQCPPGEVCSPETPSGLYFKGPAYGDDWLFPGHTVGITAEGGTQTIEIAAAGWFEEIYDFAADCPGATFSVVSLAPPYVRLRANASGTTYLRIVDPANGELYDRLSIQSLPVTDVEVAVALPSLLFWNWQTHPTRLYYGDAYLPWLVRLRNGDTRLVDEGVAFTVDTPGQPATIQAPSWDRAEILPAPDATRLEVTVTTSAGDTGTNAVDLVHEIDRIEEREGEEVPVTLDASLMLQAGLVGLTVDDRDVAMLDWAVTVIDPNGSVATDAAMIYEGTLWAFLQQVGVWQLEVSAANVTRTFVVVATPPAPAPVPPPGPPEATPDPAAGQATPDDAPDNALGDTPRGAPGWRAARVLGQAWPRTADLVSGPR